MDKNNNIIEVTVQTKDLIHALGFAASIVEKRNILSELSNIKLAVNNNCIELGVTDLDIYLNQTIGANVINGSTTTISAQTLLDIIRKMPDPEIRIRQEKINAPVQLIGKNCCFELLTLKAELFPILEHIESELNFQVPCEELARILEYTGFAMSNEETRYNLNGIYLHSNNDKFVSAATDGHRLAVASSDAPQNEQFGVIIPKKTVNELLKIIKDQRNIKSDITVTIGTNKIKFVCNNLILISKLIDGNFPEYNAFIPTDNSSKLTVDTKLLSDAISRVATITVEKFRAIKMNINRNFLEITASGEAKGAANEKLPCSSEEGNFCSFTGQDLTIGFNPNYITDVLNAIKEKRVELNFKDSFSPMLIKTSRALDSFVVMPVKV